MTRPPEPADVIGSGAGAARIALLADSGLVVDLPDRAGALRLHAALRSLGAGAATGARDPGWAGIEDLVTTLCSVTLVVDPASVDVGDLATSVRHLLAGLGIDTEHGPVPDACAHASAGASTGASTSVRLASMNPSTSVRLASAGALPAGEPDAVLAGEPGTGSAVRVLPVRFDGADLASVAAQLGCSGHAVVDQLVSRVLEVAFVGFSPGFAYLVGLPEALADLRRLDSPRPRVHAGAVAVAGGFAAVYPRASPGGWNLLGTTDAVLFDPRTPPYAVLGAGDRVRFVAERPRVSAGGRGAGHPTTEGRAAAPRDGREGPLGPTRWAAGPRGIVVESGGPCSLVQDAGRLGVASAGVPRAGAADPFSLRLANLLVGNAWDAPALEVTVQGPVLRFEAPTYVAVVGDVRVTLDGLDVPVAAPVPVAAGQRLAVGACRSGARATVAVGGGVVAPGVMGSVASDLLSGLGLGPLAAGDRLGFGPPRRPAGRLRLALPPGHALGPWAARTGLVPEGAEPARLRIVEGPDASPASTAWLVSGRWLAGQDSDRVGLRLRPALGDRAGAGADSGSGADAAGPGDPGGAGDAGRGGAGSSGAGWFDPVRRHRPASRSRGVVTGTVQLPPGGEPIVLLCDHATVGGYPVVAVVASVDVPLAAQLRPGDPVSLQVVDPLSARQALLRAERALADAVAGRFPTSAG